MMLALRACAVAARLLAAPALAWAPAAARADDAVVTSFDGTAIVTHRFPAPGLAPGRRAPTILNGPGWADTGEVDPGAGMVRKLNAAGYNVVTWAPRGFGASGGTVSVDAPAVEGRDTSAIVDMVARQPWAQLDGAGDPRIGMAGFSYGAGIQYATAIADHRIDALVPVVGWHSLATSLYKDQTVKQGWDALLYASGSASADATAPGLDPHVASGFRQGLDTGVLSDADAGWFAARGPGDAVRAITAPTMVVGGTVDTLFPLDEDIKLYEAIRRGGAPVKMVWYCGGHGTCFTGAGTRHVEALTLAWFARHLVRDPRARTGPGFEWVADDGRWRSAARWQPPPAAPVIARGRGTLKLVAGYGSGEASRATPAPAARALQVRVVAPRAAQLVGAPRLTLRYSGTGVPSRGAKLFAQLVDVRRGIVVGNQVTPIPLVLDGRRRTVTRLLAPIAAAAAKGTRYTLQLVSGSQVWAPQRGTGTIHVARATLVLPAVKPS
jgi:ABC-2 type transport system ATP-binding protein